MSASDKEVQVVVDQLLELLGYRITAGSIEIHFAEGLSQKVEVHQIGWRRRATDYGGARGRPVTTSGM